MQIPILSILTWLPLAASLLATLIPSQKKNVFRSITITILVLQGLGIIWMFTHLSAGTACASVQSLAGNVYFVERAPWIHLPLGNLGILSVHYFLGIDSLNLGLVALAWVVWGMGAMASWSINKHIKAYFILYLLLNTLIIGSLVSLDLLLFFMFFEATLIPIYFFIALWGDSQGPQAATKFFLYTLSGSICILIVVLGLGLAAYDPVATCKQASLAKQGGSVPMSIDLLQQQIASKDIVHTFDMTLLSDTKNFIPASIFHLGGHQLLGKYSMRLVGFLLLAFGFLIKLAAIPFHSWLPAAHIQAPTPISIILAGIMLKLGAYGLLRAYSIFPEGALHYSWAIGCIGIVSIFYAALNALAMKDLKAMIAYSSIAHMGFFLLGMSSLTAEGMQGALYQLISHGLVASLLFLIVGALDKRTHDRTIQHYSGLAARMPYYTTFTLLAFAAAMGIPGFSGFIAELLILLGAFRSSSQQILPLWMAIAGSLGILFNATYYVWTIQRMFGGKWSLHDPLIEAKLTDLSKTEITFLLAVVVLIICLGVFPHTFLHLTQDALAHWVNQVVEVGRANLSTVLTPISP
jgi:NADH-quinone oxidoreductase subunit M